MHGCSRGEGDSGPLLKPRAGRGCEGAGKQVPQQLEETGGAGSLLQPIPAAGTPLLCNLLGETAFVAFFYEKSN